MKKIKKTSISIVATSLLLTTFAPTAVVASELTKTNQTSNETVGVKPEVLEEGEEVVVPNREESVDQLLTSQPVEEIGTPQAETKQTSLLDGPYIDGEHTFYISNGVVTSYNGPGGDVEIPQGITTVGNWAFAYANLLSVKIPESVTSIGERAFGNNKLQNIVIPQQVTSVGDYAFWDNQLTTAILPEALENIGELAFADNQLSSIEIPESVTYLGDGAFSGNQLTNIKIPESVTYLGDYAFSGNQLMSIEIPESITYLGEYVFSGNQLTNIKIPESVTYLGDYAFSGNQLTNIKIPESVTYLGDYAFSGNQLMNIEIPESITHIGKGTFSRNKLTNIEIPESITHIGDYAFEDNQLTGINIPKGIKSLSGFGGNQLTNIEIPESVTYLGASAFSRNKLTNVEIPESVTYLGDYAFAHNYLTNIQIPKTIVEISWGAFSYNQLTSVEIPKSVIGIGGSAFAGNQLINVVIPQGVTNIGESAFADNQLTSVEIPEGISNIEYRAFSNNKLVRVTLPSTLKIIETNAFSENQLMNVEIPENVASIGQSAFEDNQLTSIIIPNLVTLISERAFANNQKLDQVEFQGDFPCYLGSHWLTAKERRAVIVIHPNTVEWKNMSDKDIISDSKIILNRVVNNEKPVMSGVSNTTIKVGDTFNALTGITATDKEDGDLTEVIEVTGSVDTTKVGTYKLTYSVTDSDGNTTSVERTITVRSNEKPVMSGVSNTTIKVGDTFNALTGITATDEEDGDLTEAIEVEGDVDTTKLGTYKLTYSVTDRDGNTTTAECLVKVDFTVATDWKDSWASTYIERAMEKGWVSTSTAFRPEDNITRAEFVKIVNQAFGFQEQAESEPYEDVKDNQWYYGEILKAVKAGYISVAMTKFRPEDTITREEVAAIITSIQNKKDANLDKIQQYADYEEISVWARESVEGVVEAGYMGKGSDKFRPKSPITRAEAVVTLGRIFE